MRTLRAPRPGSSAFTRILPRTNLANIGQVYGGRPMIKLERLFGMAVLLVALCALPALLMT